MQKYGFAFRHVLKNRSQSTRLHPCYILLHPPPNSFMVLVIHHHHNVFTKPL
jgi:hypothetical protein